MNVAEPLLRTCPSSGSHLLYIGSVVISFVTEFRIDTEVLPVFPLTVNAVILIYKRIKV